MNGLTIFSHSFRQVTGNLGMAIKVSGWLVAIYAIMGAIVLNIAPDWLNAALEQNADALSEAGDLSGSSVGLFLLFVLVALIFMLWSVSLIAIVWHRYILLEETPRGFIPYRSDFRIGRYFWYGVGISLLALLVVSLVSGFLGMIFGPFIVGSLQGGAEGQAAGFIASAFFMGLLIGLITLVIYMRMALILPAVALDEQLTLGQAWEATAGHTVSIIVLGLAMAFINAVVPLVINLAFSELGLVNLVLASLYHWFYFMLNISVLSTLYGHIVQKREVY